MQTLYVQAITVRLFILMGLLMVAPEVGSQVQGPHKTDPFKYNLFISPTTRMSGICDPRNQPQFKDCESLLEAEAVAYYKAIGIFQPVGDNDPVKPHSPTPDRGSFSAWKATLGFSPDPNSPVSDEIRATYFNNGDLQFGRDMHCRQRINARLSGRVRIIQSIDYACYVSNFSNSGQPGASADPGQSLALAVAPATGPAAVHPAATVVMEVSAIPQLIPVQKTQAGRPLSPRFTMGMKFGDVRFFAYDGAGNPIISARLDSEEPKALPGLCLACHGGAYQASQSGGSRVYYGNFLPFDTSTFLYGGGNLTEVAQREAFRRLNQFVLSTRPARQTIVDLIAGWYQWCGGVGKPSCFIDEVSHPFIPGDPSSCAPGSATCLAACPAAGAADRDKYTCGWATGTPVTSAPFDMRAFYRQVVAKECRTCHIAVADSFNVENYAEWFAKAQSVGDDVFNLQKMPFGEVPFLDFWSGKPGANGETAKNLMKAFFGCPAPPAVLTGDGTDIVKVEVIPDSVPIDQVGLTLKVTNANPTWWKAVNLGGFETWTQDARQSSSITIPVTALPNSPTLEIKKAKIFGVHTGVETITLPNAPFTYGGCTLSFDWAKDS